MAAFEQISLMQTRSDDWRTSSPATKLVTTSSVLATGAIDRTKFGSFCRRPGQTLRWHGHMVYGLWPARSTRPKNRRHCRCGKRVPLSKCDCTVSRWANCTNDDYSQLSYLLVSLPNDASWPFHRLPSCQRLGFARILSYSVYSGHQL